jgi:hypothetical protein
VPDRKPPDWPNEGRESEECRKATVAAYLGVWLALSRHWIEACAAIAGLTGAWLLASNDEHAAWGWWAFLASNVAWIAFGWTRRHWFLVLQQVGFTASSVWGIWTWMGPQ